MCYYCYCFVISFFCAEAVISFGALRHSVIYVLYLSLAAQNETLDQELSEAMVLIKTLERRLQEVQGQRDLIQQECAGHIKHIHDLKESNFKLTEGLEEAISKAELYKGRWGSSGLTSLST